MVSTVTTYGNCFAVFSHIRLNSREEIPGWALSIELSHGREKVRPPFSSTGVGKQNNRNRRCEVLFTNDLRSSAPQSPAGTRARLGSGTRNQVGKINCKPG